MAVVKLSVNSHALLSLYQLYSHNCRFLGKDYQFVQTVTCSHVWQCWRVDFTNVYWRITWPTQSVFGIW